MVKPAMGRQMGHHVGHHRAHPREVAMRWAVTAAVGVVLLAGCGGGDGSSAGGATSSTCTKLSASALDAIAQGLIVKADLVEGQAVELPKDAQQLGFAWVAAVKVTDPQNGDQVTVLGLDSAESPGASGPITVAGAVSRVYFQWGAAATKDSPMGRFQQELYLSDSSRAAQDCL